jgi:hypothetical protein
MEYQDEMDQFKVLEEKVGVLIDKVSSLKDGNELLTAKIREQDQTIADLKVELDGLKSTRDKTKVRIQSILDKMSKMDI